MGTVERLLFICFLGGFVHAQSMLEEHNAVFSPTFFERDPPYPFEQHFDSLSFPDISWLNEVPPFMRIPKVQVFCDNSQLSLLVDRIFIGGILDAAQIELGDGCYSNGRLPNQLVFIYSLDQCGTKHVLQNGIDVFSNFLHFHLKKKSFTWWTPPTVQVTCAPKRSGPNPYFLAPVKPLEHGRNFNMKTMNPSWTNTAISNVFEKGQLMHFQVSANTKPGEQLFIQSCHVLTSPDHHSQPNPAVIFNKGCTTHLHTPHALVQFVASHRLDVVNFIVNTSYLASELYVRCRLLISDQGVASYSKSCNYNFKSSRWEELSGNAQACQCCNSMCGGISLKHLPNDARGVVTTGPFIIVDKQTERKLNHSVPEADYTQSDMNQTQDAEPSENDLMAQNAIYSNTMSQAQPSEVLKNMNNGGSGGDVLALFDGWVIGPKKAASERKSHRKGVFRNGRSKKESLKVVDLHPASEQMQADVAEMQQQETNEMDPLIHSKMQLSSLDGTQMLTYEEEVIQRRFGMNRANKCKKCLSDLLDLLRRMDKAE